MRHEDLLVEQLRVRRILPAYKHTDKVPASGTPGWPVGSNFKLTNAQLGQAIDWVNVGTVSGCLFVPVGPTINGYGVAYAGYRAATTGSATQNFTQDHINAADIAMGGYAVSDDTDNVAAVISADGRVTFTLSADPLAAHGLNWLVLRSRCIPSHDIFAAGTFTCVTGSATQTITVTGAQAGDIALCTMAATDDTDTIAKAVVTANTVTVTMSADPLAAHALHYVVLRPRGSFKPSHYIAYAGTFTCLTGSATQTITVTGAAVGDVAIVNYKNTDDTDTILKAVVTANTLTLTLSADPLAAHQVSYMLLRAYA